MLYNFAELPQTLLLNPGLEVNYKYHVGLPLLSGVSSEIGLTGFSVADIFAVDSKTIRDKISSVLNTINSSDYLKINSQIEVFSAGFRFDQKTYISFGFYQELAIPCNCALKIELHFYSRMRFFPFLFYCTINQVGC